MSPTVNGQEVDLDGGYVAPKPTSFKVQIVIVVSDQNGDPIEEYVGKEYPVNPATQDDAEYLADEIVKAADAITEIVP
jgi:hypothetical protein